MDRRKFMGGMAAAGAVLGAAGRGMAGGYDLVIEDVNALLADGFSRRDIGIKGGVIAKVAPPGELAGQGKALPGRDLYVSPGWVDLHVHYVDWAHRKSAGSPISRLGPAHGVTAMVDAGTVGCANYDRLEKSVADGPQVDCFSWLSIKREGIKITDFYTTRTGYDNIPAMEQVIASHRGRIKGLKVRADNQVSARSDRLYYVRKIREAGDRFGLPAMIHISSPPPTLADILPYMKEGDMVTHFLRGQEHSIIGTNGKVLDEVKEAKARGVRFDVGHGVASFAFADAERALEQGFDNFTISSDLYSISAPLYARTFANVLTQFLAVGMDLPSIMERASTRPARVIAIEREIREGAEASLTVFSVAGGDFDCKDVTRKTRKSDRRIIPEWSIIRGELTRAGDLDRKLFLK